MFFEIALLAYAGPDARPLPPHPTSTDAAAATPPCISLGAGPSDRPVSPSRTASAYRC